MNENQIQDILFKHTAWLMGNNNGKRADLCEADLRGANLCRADLREANLCGANLRGVDLCEADLREANLRGVYLRGVDLREANLCGAYLREANLCGADLREANLCGTDLRGAYLREANLCGTDLCEADLREANLCRADLRGANLCRAYLCGADLRGAKNIPFLPQTIVAPEEGSFIGWKQVNSKWLIKLEICEEAKRSSATTRKCRCEFAKVISINKIVDGKVSDETINSIANHAYGNFVYTVGEIVRPDSFDEDRWNERSHGIHFFITKQEAIDYKALIM